MIDSAPNLAKRFSSAVKFLRSLILQRWNLFPWRRRARHETGAANSNSECSRPTSDVVF